MLNSRRLLRTKQRDPLYCLSQEFLLYFINHFIFH